MHTGLGILNCKSNCEHVSQRPIARIMPTVDAQSELKPIVNLVTTWNSHCGIATYSAFLAAELKERAKMQVVKIPDLNSISPYFLILGLRTGKSPDLVHVQFAEGAFPTLWLGGIGVPFSALLFYLGLSIGDKPIITTFHEIPKTIRGGGLFRILLNKLICLVSDLIIVHNSESKDLISGLYRVEESNIRVVPHGSYQTPLFLNKDDSKKKLGLWGKTVITVPGFIVERKGHDIVLALMPRFENNVQLVFAGEPRTSSDESYCEKLKDIAKHYNCSGRVTFTGYFLNLSEILNATDIGILPYRSTTESGILRVLVAFRVPTITSDLKAFKEIQREYNCIELFQTENSEDLLAKIRSLLSSSKKRESLQKGCMKMWEETKWSRVAEKHMSIYTEAMAHNCDPKPNQ